ncbi:helix-turn-helix domain-containing protein [Sphingobium phenoxybenzoativorans]|uniref:helix-turn-helix domain-containing protein n=1 Tax=Sphingobium phenoxybenzoativorans TaxID=1592790 RepID=UPI00087330FC|nr:helix-turn-helix domain-containing protein [Sphingobium phenoxybenzoativorans]
MNDESKGKVGQVAERDWSPYNLGPRPLTVETVAERWECSPSMVRKVINSGELGHFRVGNLIRILAVDVEKYEATRVKVGAPSEDMSSSATTFRPNIARAKRRREPMFPPTA